MKRFVVLVSSVSFLVTGCTSTKMRDTGGALSTTSAVLVALPLIPFVNAYHAVSGDIEKDKKRRDELTAQLDAVYEKRIAMLAQRDPVKDADVAFDGGSLAFLSTVPGGDLFSGLSPSWRNPFVRTENSEIVRKNEFLNYLQTLVAKDPSDKPKNDGALFSSAQHDFEDACWRYRTKFNREMYRKIEETKTQPGGTDNSGAAPLRV